MGGFAVTINSVPVPIDAGATMQKMLHGRGTFSCKVTSEDASVRPSEGQTLQASTSAVARFTGEILTAKETGALGVGVGDSITTHILAVDFNHYAERRYVLVTIPAGTLKEQITFIVTNYLADKGVTVHAGQVDGPSLPAVTYDYNTLRRVKAVLDEICLLAIGYVWQIDQTKALRAYEPSDNPAPFDIAEGDGNAMDDLEVEPDRSNYANWIFGRFASAARAAYAHLATTDNFTDDEEVEAGGRTYTFKDTLGSAANQVLIGATVTDSLNNLIAAIVAGAGAGTLYTEATTVNTVVTAYLRLDETTLTAVALKPGESGNSSAVSTTAADAEWITEGSAATAFLTFGTNERLDNIVQAKDDDEIGDHGVWDDVVDMLNVYDPTVAQETVDAVLANRLVVPKNVTYPTRGEGLEPGQSQNVNVPIRHINEPILIMGLTATEGDGDLIDYRVTGVTGAKYVPGWHDSVRSWGGGGSSGGGTVVGAGGGGGTGIASKVIYQLASSKSEWVTSPSGPGPVAASALEILIDTATLTSLAGTVYLRVRTMEAGVTVLPEFAQGPFLVGTGTVVGAADDPIDSQTFEAVVFGITLIEGRHWYRLNLTPSVVGKQVQAVGYVELR